MTIVNSLEQEIREQNQLIKKLLKASSYKEFTDILFDMSEEFVRVYADQAPNFASVDTSDYAEFYEAVERIVIDCLHKINKLSVKVSLAKKALDEQYNYYKKETDGVTGKNPKMYKFIEDYERDRKCKKSQAS